MKYFITGATGLVGGVMARKLPIQKENLGALITRLSPSRMREVREPIEFSLEFDILDGTQMLYLGEIFVSTTGTSAFHPV